MNPYLLFVLAVLVIDWLFSLIVEMLNLKHSNASIPAELSDLYDAEKYQKSQNYLRDNTILKEVKAAIMLAITLAFILLGGFAWLHMFAVSLTESLILQGLIFFGIMIGASLVLGLPFDLFDTFVLEERYGFNKQTPKTFILDILKGLLLGVLIGTPILSLMLWFFSSVSYAWLWVWASITVISLFIQFIAPVVIMPMFNKFTPLEEGDLKQEIGKYAAKQKYTIKGIFSIDGSKRSTKANAYFTGFGKTKRIALYDTLIEKLAIKEIVAVLAHEVGHCKLGHIKKSIVLSIPLSLLNFYLLSIFLTKAQLYAAFQIEGTPIYAGFVFFGIIYAPIQMIIGLGINALSRKHEFQADAYAVKTTGKAEHLINALKKLTTDSLGSLNPHPLKVFMDYSHPPLLKRIRAMKKVKG